MSDQGAAALSMAEIVANLRTYGLSKPEIAAELGRSVRMVTKIERGETSGELYRGVLTELYENGRRTSPRPPRRRSASGGLMAVRAKGGGTAPPPAPAADVDELGPSERRPGYTPTYTDVPKRGRFSSAVTYLSGGGRQVEVNAPKSDGKGRQLADATLQEEMRKAAQGQRRTKFQVVWSNGRVMEIGGKSGYNARDVNARSRNEGQAPFTWLEAEGYGRYPELEAANDKIVSVVMTTYGHQQPRS